MNEENLSPGRPRRARPFIPDCTLVVKTINGFHDSRAGMCWQAGGCEGCGWRKDEIERRRELIRQNGLAPDPRTGLRRFIITRRAE